MGAARLSAIVTSAWRSATRVATRDPLLTVLVLALVAVVIAALVGRRESWQATPGGLTEWEKQSHKTKVEKICAGGQNLAHLQSDEKLQYLKKYDPSLLKDACSRALEEWLRKKKGEEAVEAVNCKHGACPSQALALTYPCLNSSKQKCCKIIEGKPSNCRELGEGWRTDATRTYDCSQDWANCQPKDTTKRRHCYWGQGANKGKCCLRPESKDCVQAGGTKGTKTTTTTTTTTSDGSGSKYVPATIPDGTKNRKKTLPKCSGCAYYTRSVLASDKKKAECYPGYFATDITRWKDGNTFGDYQCANTEACKTCAVQKHGEFKARTSTAAYKPETLQGGAINKKLTIPRCAGCTYYTKSHKNDGTSWDCLGGYKDTGLAGRTDVGEFERRQCASSDKCKTCAVNKAEDWKKNKAVPVPDRLEPPTDNQAPVWVVRLYKDKDYGNERQSFASNMNGMVKDKIYNLSDYGSNDMVSSVKIEGSVAVTLYKDENGGGTKIRLQGPLEERSLAYYSDKNDGSGNPNPKQDEFQCKGSIGKHSNDFCFTDTASSISFSW